MLHRRETSQSTENVAPSPGNVAICWKRRKPHYRYMSHCWREITQKNRFFPKPDRMLFSKVEGRSEVKKKWKNEKSCNKKTRGSRGPWVAHLSKMSKVTVEPFIKTPRGIIWTSLVDDILMMLYTKFESSGSCSYTQDVLKFHFKTFLLTPWPTYVTNWNGLNNLNTTQGSFLWSFVKFPLAVQEMSFEVFLI